MKKIDYYGMIRIAAAIGLAFVITTIIIFSVSENPIDALSKFITGPFSTKRNFFNIIERMIPLVFCGLAINVMHKSGLFSMAADSSFYMGAVLATSVALGVQLPNFLHQTVLILIAGVVGGLIASIPAILKKTTGANELVTSLMLNYVFFNFGLWIIMTYFLDASTGATSYKFPQTAMLGKMLKGTRLHYGFVVMVAAVGVMYVLMSKCNFGKKLQLVGSNRNFAKYAGIPLTGTVILSQAIGGVLAGVGGAIEMVGMNTRFNWVTPVQYVWDGIIINLLANTNPIMIPLSAFFISYIRVGADIMSRGSDVSNEIVSIIQAVIILLIASERFLYKLKKNRDEKQALENRRLTTQAEPA